MKFSAPRGTRDILPEATPRWQWLEDCFRQVCRRYGYREIRTPTFEETELFRRSAGEGSELVKKQMYTFTDRGGRSVTLRPEGTAPVVRAYLEHHLGARGGVQKLYYIASIFRYDRPQSGRYREHTQVGVEAIGAPGPEIDAEIIALYLDFLGRLGITQATLEVNSIGDAECRPRYIEALRAYYQPHLEHLCGFCQERYAGNTLRLLDCKGESERSLVEGAPNILDFLCSPCQAHFDGLRGLLDGLELPYRVNPRIVRGLDYYGRTAFEVIHGGLGAQNAIAGGGRYDGLAAELGGPPTPGIGFGSGIDRLLLAAEKEGIAAVQEAAAIYVVAVTDEARPAVLQLAQELRKAGLSVEIDHLKRSLKAQMREADRLQSPQVLIIGDDELAAGTVLVKDMKTGEQLAVPQDEVVALLAAEHGGEAS